MLIATFTLALSGLTYTAPPAWHARPPASSMRVAEFVIPRTNGDPEDAELIIYYFGAAGGGGADANVERWIGQVRQPDGSSSKSKAHRAERTINGMNVTRLPEDDRSSEDRHGGTAGL